MVVMDALLRPSEGVVTVGHVVAGTKLHYDPSATTTHTTHHRHTNRHVIGIDVREVPKMARERELPKE